MRVLVVNHARSAVCGIHDLGKRIHTCLSRSTVLEVGYADCNSWDEYLLWRLVHLPDVVIVNYRADLMPWWRPTNGSPGELAVLHQYEAATVDARAAELLAAGFDHVIVHDPLLRPSDPRVHAVGRPIPETVDHSDANTVPQIGSFGFAFPHKGFADVAAEINDQCVEAVYALHMPEAYFNGVEGRELYTAGILADIATRITKPGIDVFYTNEHFGERELVARLASNHVNCLLYAPGQPDAGLSSALDYLIAARRPILVSEAEMFRAAGTTAAVWPQTRLGDILDNYDKYQQVADELYEFHHGRLVADIERIVSEL